MAYRRKRRSFKKRGYKSRRRKSRGRKSSLRIPIGFRM